MQKLYEEIKLFNTTSMPEKIKQTFMSFHKGSRLYVYFQYTIGRIDNTEKGMLNKWFIDNGASGSETVLVYYDYPEW